MADTGGSYETLRTGLNDARDEAAERANLGFALGRALDARQRAPHAEPQPKGPGAGIRRAR